MFSEEGLGLIDVVSKVVAVAILLVSVQYAQVE